MTAAARRRLRPAALHRVARQHLHAVVAVAVVAAVAVVVAALLEMDRQVPELQVDREDRERHRR